MINLPSRFDANLTSFAKYMAVPGTGGSAKDLIVDVAFGLTCSKTDFASLSFTLHRTAENCPS